MLHSTPQPTTHSTFLPQTDEESAIFSENEALIRKYGWLLEYVCDACEDRFLHKVGLDKYECPSCSTPVERPQ